ncbi:glycoside hydrolase family 2 TIM barrel-domain containing protein [Plantactinospora soyae]|uniref:beta-galactosidase n=1 Tax=Plantactinospora soyae TaxID=1544732 RepID=A0A927MEQ4_9ACTN|nr:glycoside hydrolase family 2 TIM barrel-domain containing protein [Plantactinospora soyae]MBE1491726.1 beta-galactosidase [Plantactinospora soyae]
MPGRGLLAAFTIAVLLAPGGVPATAAPGREGGGASPGGGPVTADDVHRYLEDPGMTGEGQEPPHALLRPYPDARTAAADITEHSARSPWTASLNGGWRLAIAARPDLVPAGFHAEDFDVSGWPTATVPHTWQSDFVDHPMFRNIPEEIWPDDPPRVPRDVNPTGAYVRSFEVSTAWSDRRTVLRFEGVTSGYFVWVNGRYVGYDQGGYTPAEFDVTDSLRPGTNRVAVQVHRWGSGAYLEDVDQWRYSGIFRDVWLYATPRTYLRDAYITTDLDDRYTDATLTARIGLGGAADGHTVRGTLLGADGRRVATMTGQSTPTGQSTLTATVRNPAKWSADAPRLYALVLELLDPDGRVVHTSAQAVGFREVEVRNAQLLVNGERILIKGTNRAETDPETGRHVSRTAQRRDVELMKSLHINAVRTSHYPSDPYLYDLANRHGLWIADEVDIETHSHENCPTNCLASRPEWQAAFADRFQAMVHRDKNHPSVIIWDTGNEAGLGTAHYAMAEWADANEPTRLLYHQSNSPNGDAPYADVWGPRYPTPGYVESIARTTTRPVVFGEYAHAMGNSVGNFDRFWDLVRRYPSLQGGFIWDWAEANLRQPLVLTPDSSPHRIQAFFVGKPSLVAGRRGQAVALSSLDDFVDVFRDPRLDFTGAAVTLDAWVRPGEWAGSFPVVTKGRAYALQMRDRTTLEFGVTTGSGWAAVAAAVPADWYDAWHRVTGIYDGTALRLQIDGVEVATAARSGALDPGLYEVNVGRNAATQQDDLRTRLARGLVDDVRVYGAALSGEELAADPVQRAALALDFDRTQRRGEFDSLGISLSGTDGLVGTDRYLQPETTEVAWAHAPVRFSTDDAATGRVRIRNEQPAGALDVRLRWSLLELDRTLRSGTRPLRLGPGQTVDVDLGAGPANPQDRQRRLRLEAVGADGSRYGWDEFAAGGRVVPGVLPAVPGGTAPALTRDGEAIVVSGPGWRYRFDTTTGTLRSMSASGRELLRTGPELDVYRPPTSNETYGWGTADREIWHALGLDRLRTEVTGVSSSVEQNSAVVEVRSVARGSASFEIDQTMRYRVDGGGTITLDHRVTPRGSGVSQLPYLPRVGVQVKVPEEMRRFAWYGRGPHETYNDRNSGAFTDVWRSSVDEEYVRYSRPQAYGNHTSTRWATLSDGRQGLLVGSSTNADLDVSVTPYDELARAEYDFQLPLVRNRGWVTLHAAAGETGMGETPNSVLDEYRVPANRSHEYTLTLRPLTGREIRAGGVPDSRAPAPCPADVAVTTGAEIRPGEPQPVTVTVTSRCADGLRNAVAGLAAPEGWTVTPATAALDTVRFGAPEEAVFTVTAPPGTDYGGYDLTATVSAVGNGFPTTVEATTTVRAPLPPADRWVSDLPFLVAENGWGPVERDLSNGEQAAGDGRRLSIGGTTYDKGIGAHAASRIVVDLAGRCTSFRADVGVDDETGASGSVGFEVWVDGERRGASGVLTGAAGPERISADVTGGQRLELRITDAGNGNGADHGDWAGARLTCP